MFLFECHSARAQEFILIQLKQFRWLYKSTKNQNDFGFCFQFLGDKRNVSRFNDIPIFVSASADKRLIGSDYKGFIEQRSVTLATPFPLCVVRLLFVFISPIQTTRFVWAISAIVQI